MNGDAPGSPSVASSSQPARSSAGPTSAGTGSPDSDVCERSWRGGSPRRSRRSSDLRAAVGRRRPHPARRLPRGPVDQHSGGPYGSMRRSARSSRERGVGRERRGRRTRNRSAASDSTSRRSRARRFAGERAGGAQVRAMVPRSPPTAPRPPRVDRRGRQHRRDPSRERPPGAASGAARAPPRARPRGRPCSRRRRRRPRGCRPSPSARRRPSPGPARRPRCRWPRPRRPRPGRRRPSRRRPARTRPRRGSGPPRAPRAPCRPGARAWPSTG